MNKCKSCADDKHNLTKLVILTFEALYTQRNLSVMILWLPVLNSLNPDVKLCASELDI